jgi:hypothetical protein
LVGEKHRLDGFHFTCCALQIWDRIMFKGKCAECNAHWNSKAFKSRRAGYDLPVADERRLSFAFESASNNKLCGGCHLKNYKALKHSRDEHGIEHASYTKKVKANDNNMFENARIDVEEVVVDENADVIEREGTAISVLLYLSLL